jgi:tetratricopeptide (TPR) repeat protein
MRNASLLLLFAGVSFGATVGNTVAGDAAGWAQKGRARFEICEFKDAARDFTRALRYQPEDASLYHWLGKSYARMAEISSPLHASRDARNARVNLERAVDLDPRNHEYLRELFDFYLVSPEWFSGGLGKAANLVERIEPDDPGAQAFLRELVAGAHQEYSGTYWRMRQATELPTREIGRMAP